MIKKAGQSALLLAVYKQKIYQSAKFCSNIKKTHPLKVPFHEHCIRIFYICQYIFAEKCSFVVGLK